MSKKTLAEDILEGIKEAIAYAQGKKVPGLTVVDKELLKRKMDLENKKVKTLTLDEVFKDL